MGRRINSNMSDSPITDVVFDSGGVIFTKGTDIVLRQFQKCLHKTLHELMVVFSGDPEWGPKQKPGELYRAGKITRDEFWACVRDQLSLSDDETVAKMEQMWLTSYTPHPYMFDILAALQPQYTLTLWTGNVPERITYLDATYDLLKYFSKTCFSFEGRWAKEQTAAYTSLIEVLAPTPPENALVIDDKPKFVNIARKYGFNAIMFEGPKQLLVSLRDYGIVVDLAL